MAVLENTGGRLEHICSITVFYIDKLAYLEVGSKLGKIWRILRCKHYPVMSLIFVADMLDSPDKDRVGSNLDTVV